MNVLRPGDEPMHYQDGSHRWVPPTSEMDQEAWEAAIRAHLNHHRETFGGGQHARTNQGPARTGDRASGWRRGRRPDGPEPCGNGHAPGGCHGGARDRRGPEPDKGGGRDHPRHGAGPDDGPGSPRGTARPGPDNPGC